MFLLHVTYPATGHRDTIPFATAFQRALHVVSLSSQPVLLRLEDV